MNKEKPFLDESLYSACQNNNINLVKELLQNSRIDINKQHKDGNTPLIIACRKNNLAIVKELLKDPRIDINKQSNYFKETPLDTACNCNHLEIAKEFFKDSRIVINTRNYTSLEKVCLLNYVENLMENLGISKIYINEIIPVNNLVPEIEEFMLDYKNKTLVKYTIIIQRKWKEILYSPDYFFKTKMGMNKKELFEKIV